MKKLIAVFLLGLAVTCLGGEALLTGHDLSAWKVARSGVRSGDLSRYWQVPDNTLPVAKTMKRTATGDYEFTFVLQGRERDTLTGEELNWQKQTMKVVARVDVIEGTLRYEGLRIVK